MSQSRTNHSLLASWQALALAVVTAALAGCAGKAPSPPPGEASPAGDATGAVPRGDSYRIDGQVYHPRLSAKGYKATGLASWYGRKFHGQKTASGEVFDMHKPMAAHRTLPLPTVARVTNLENGRSTKVRINDRGPFVDTHERIIDLSYGAAKELGMEDDGVQRVRVEALRQLEDAGSARATAQPTPEPPAIDPEAVEGSGGSVYLQLGAFTRASNAIRLKDRLRSLEMERVVITTTQHDGQRFFRVRLGPLADASSATNLANRLRQEGLPDGRTVRD